MHSIIVVPMHSTRPDDHLRLEPGDSLPFGRVAGPHGPHLTIAHEGVSRTAGEITAAGAYWRISNLSSAQTYVVENPEGAGEHIKVAPGRLDAPVPFEFARVVLPAGNELLSFDVWAPRHDFLDRAGPRDGVPTTCAFPLDRGKRYFHVLVALCAARLRGEPHAPLPTAEELAEQLRPLWPAASRTSVAWNIDYLAVKLRLKPAPDTVPGGGPRLNGKKERLVSLALRFDLVREDDLALLDANRLNGDRLDADRSVVR
ncbi:FHA domain-containing protein [Streptomyces sp. NPDC059010]|uniref:FHA domain-containing protein n=1 Tax=Streptomyces sp. NPDC059010 TaxID=3346695 RepID=UPI00367B2DA3